MGRPVNFRGTNRILAAPGGRDDVQDMDVFNNGTHSVSCWKLSAGEIEEVQRTGCIWLSVMFGQTAPPVFVGGEEEVRYVVADTGVWKR